MITVKTATFLAVWLSCIDGDTCKFRILSIHPLFGNSISVRFARIDVPDCDLKRKPIAKKFVEEMLKKVPTGKVYLRECKRGKYFRLICEVHANHVNLSDALLWSGLAVKYGESPCKK